MPYPNRQRIIEALLILVARPSLSNVDGERRHVTSKCTYEPLADYFELTEAERTMPAVSAKGKTEWVSRVAGAVQTAREHGWLDAPDFGYRHMWRATELGVAHARALGDARRGEPRLAVLMDAKLELEDAAQRAKEKFPAPKLLEEPLLVLLTFRRDGRAGVESHEVYRPLGTYFGLTAEQMQLLRTDRTNGGRLWDNVVQNAKLSLQKSGLVEPKAVSGMGVWMPSESGVARARQLASQFASHPLAACLGLGVGGGSLRK